MGTKSERRGRKVFYWIAEPSYNRVATERTSFWWFRKRLSRVQSSREASSHTEIHKTWNLNYPASRNLLSFVVNFFSYFFCVFRFSSSFAANILRFTLGNIFGYNWVAKVSFEVKRRRCIERHHSFVLKTRLFFIKWNKNFNFSGQPIH